MIGALALPVLMALASTCAPSVAPTTLLSVARAESGFDPLTIGINTAPHRSLHPTSAAETVAMAHTLMRRGVNFDIGVAQINSRNLPRLGLSLEDAVDPCKNLAAEAVVLRENFVAAQRRLPGSQQALRAALSAYNTGNPERGLRNGYVDKVYLAAAQLVPALQGAGVRDPEPPPDAVTGAVRLHAEAGLNAAPSTPALDVFAREPAPTLVWSPHPALAQVAPRSRSNARSPREPS